MIHRTPRTLCSIASLSLAAGAAFALAGPVIDGPTETVHVCWPIDESGALTGTTVQMEIAPEVLEFQSGRERSAVADNRLDLVIVGDGYTTGEMAQYTADVSNVVSTFFLYEPFISYEPYFRVTQVDVVSPESGVDNDPTQGVSRVTALDMGYWCSGIERLLCVDTGKAYNAAFAAGVPGVDQMLALANSSKYGGAGYPGSNLGTAAGQNSSAVQIAIHEMGHSLGNLADEYDYGGAQTYTGGEPSSANSSIYTAAEQVAQQRKWHQWVGATGDPRFDDPIGSYEGSSYSVFGIYRPSGNSMMRSLFRQFNQPSAEALILQIYRSVTPIDDATTTALPIGSGETISVTPMRPIGHPLAVQWSVDGVPEPLLNGVELIDVDSLGLATGAHTVAVTVTDFTAMVRNEANRDLWMTQTRSWQLQIGCLSPADLNGDGIVDLGDISVFIDLFLAGDLTVDLNGDGILDSGDIGAFIEAFLNPC
ncbi:MAG: hypothetical protein ACI89L_001455 [Phycisphaerales bacterium]|jgi:hypothetical protein